MKKSSNYLPVWTANLGVVPLFLLRIFLFCPLFLSLWARLFSVTRVLDAIIELLSAFLTNQYRARKLTNSLTYVNVIFIIAWANLLYFSFIAVKAHCATADLWLAQGEHKDLSIPQGIKNFTIGNPETISYKITNNSRALLIKGKRPGSTEILVWDKKGQKYSWMVFVLARARERQIEEIARELQGQDLQVVPVAEGLWVEGTIKKVSTYILLQKILLKEKKALWIKAEVDLEVKKWIIGDIYQSFYGQNVQNIKCWWDKSQILCQIPEMGNPTELVKHFEENYGVQFVKNQFSSPQKNFRLKFKIIQIENITGNEINFGLDQLNGSLGDIFKMGLTEMLFKNSIAFKRSDYQFSTLASPQVAMGLNEPSTIEIGQEIPYETNSANNGKSVSWKFAGLKIVVKLSEISDLFKLEYESELSDGQVNSAIKGNKGKSKVSVEINKPIELFQIELKTNTKDVSGLPLFSQIPLLGEIFKSNSNKETHKRISALVLLEEVIQ